MYIVPEARDRGLVTAEAAYAAVEAVFGAMAARDARNFPVVREALGHEDALYGFKGGFDASGMALGLKAGGYWPHNLERRGIINHQSTVFLFDPDTGRLRAMVGGNLLTALADGSGLLRVDPASGARGCEGAGHGGRRAPVAFPAARGGDVRDFEKVIAWNYHPEMLPKLAETAAEIGLPFEAVSSSSSAPRRT
jgi:alanine dehydrogenase